MSGGGNLDARRRRKLPGASELTAWGAVAGLATGLPVGALMGYQRMLDDRGIGAVPAWGVFILYATAVGAAIGLVVAYRHRGLAVAATGGVLVGLLSWLLFWLTVNPVLHRQTPSWSVLAAAEAYQELVASVLHGGLAGAVVHGFLSLRARSPRSEAASPEAERLARVVIVGGGFGGLSAAKRFERLALRGGPIDVTLISDSNFLLFTPMLAEVASGALEPSHISAPVRAAAAHTRFRHGAVDDIDTPTAGPSAWSPARPRPSGFPTTTSSSRSAPSRISSTCPASRHTDSR